MVCDDNNCELKEDSREIISQEVDADLFQILLENALTDHGHDRSNENAASSKKLTRKRRTNIAKIINNNDNDVNLKNLKVDKIYMRRKTRRHNNN
jgi:ribonuclease HII